MIIISGVVLVITILIYCVFQGLSYKKYIDFFAPLDDKSYSYKNFFPVAWHS